MSIFGNIRTPDEVEQAVLNTVREWGSTYLAEVERQKGLTAGDLPRFKSYTPASEFNGLPGDEQLPMVIAIAPGLSDQPRKDGRRKHRATWQVAVVVLVSVRRTPRTNPRQIAGLYGGALRALLIQRASLEGFAAGTEWVDELYQDIPTEDARGLGAVRVVIDVEVDNVVSGNAGPAQPSPEADPLAAYPDPPEITDTVVEGNSVGGGLGSSASPAPTPDSPSVPGSSVGIGINIAPSWNSYYQNHPSLMWACIDDLGPEVVRMPWDDTIYTHAAVQGCVDRGIIPLVIYHDYQGTPDATTPEQFAAQVAALGLDVYVEGLNEPDLNAGHDAPIDPAILAYITDAQQRLYAAVADRWPVLSPSAAWRQNDSVLVTLPSDIGSIHRYSSRAPVEADAQVPQVGKPVWVTETGWSTYKKPFPSNQWVISEENQRDWILSMRSMTLNHGAEKVLVYQLMDSVPRDIFNQANAGPATKGVYRDTGVAKLSAQALRA